MISIIMPAYNVEDYIAESIKSVRNQTYTNWELIIVNDGSTDHTAKVVEDFLYDDRIRFIQKQNEGVSVARNIGIEESKGNFIAFLDGDDIWKQSFLEETYSLLKQNKAVKCFVYSGYNYLWDKDRYTHKKFNYEEGSIHNFINEKGFNIPMSIISILIPSNVLKKYNILFSRGCTFGEDTEFILKLLSVLEAKAVKKELLHYVRRQGSSTNSAWTLTKANDVFMSYCRAIEFIKLNYQKDDKELIYSKCREIDIYYRFRYLWGLMKHGYYNDVYKKVDEWYNDLEDVLKLKIRINRKIQCKILLRKSILLWKLFKVK